METTALAPTRPTANTAVARADDVELGLVTGETGRMTLKRLELAYGVGGLQAAGYNPGDLVVDRKARILSRSTPPKYQKVEVVIISAMRYMKEWLTGDMNAARVQPRRWATVAEAIDAGMEPNWTGPEGSRTPPNVAPAIDLQVLIKQPEWPVVNASGEPDGEERFIFDLGPDGFWCPAIFSADKLLFERFDTTIRNTQILQGRKQGVNPSHAKLFTCIFTLHTENVKRKTRDLVMPTLQRKMIPDAGGRPVPAELSAEAVRVLTDMLPGLMTARVADHDDVKTDDVPA